MAGAITAPTTTITDRIWTVSDLDRMPPGFKYEILDGVLYMTAMPLWPHPGVVENLQRILLPWVHERKLGRVLGAQTGVHLNERNYVDPDLIFLRNDQVPKCGGRCSSAALAVEVLSPSNLRAPREDREEFFRRVHVEEVWYVDHEARTLEIRRLSGSGYETERIFRGEDLVTTRQLPGLEFRVDALWEGLDD
jgi:Uma2 family endonuclease